MKHVIISFAVLAAAFSLASHSAIAPPLRGGVVGGSFKVPAASGERDRSHIIDLLTTQPNYFVGATGDGPDIAYCSVAGCDPSGPHLLAEAYVRGRSPGLNAAQSVALAVDWINDKSPSGKMLNPRNRL